MLMPNRNKANINAISITRAMASVAGPTCDCKSGCAPLTLMRLARNGHGSMSDLSSLLWEERKSNFGAVRSVDDPERTRYWEDQSSGKPAFRKSSETSLIARRLRLEIGGSVRCSNSVEAHSQQGECNAGESNWSRTAACLQRG